MKTPFVYGEIATGINFTDREEETKHLVQNFKSLVNTIIISPRRWGKSSLVYKASDIAQKEDKRLRICHIDLFNVRNETHFYELFAQKVISAMSSKWDDVLQTAHSLMGKIIPKLTMSDNLGSGLSFEFNFDKDQMNLDTILDLPEKLAVDKNLRIMVCIDEFQNISDLHDGDYILRRLRSHWQHHHHAGYCLYGSKRHMMSEIFNKSSQPFYRFGDLLMLKKIPRQYWISFFIQRFKDAGKEISEPEANMIAALVADHPYYCQQLAQISWLRTIERCTEEIVNDAHIALMEQLSLAYENLTEGFTNQQIYYLHALVNEEENLTSMAVMQKYGLSSSTSVQRCFHALTKMDVIDKISGKIEFQDPVYKFWLKSRYFV